MVARRRADLLEVIVLAGDAETLLRGGGAGVGALLEAEEGILELHHAGVREQQRRVGARYQGRAWDAGVTALLEERQISLADLRAGELLHPLLLRPGAWGSRSLHCTPRRRMRQLFCAPRSASQRIGPV
jgi:hypothetical protein